MTFVHKNRKWLLHLAFWVVYSFFFFYQISHPRGGREPDWDRVFQDFSFHIFCMTSICYLNYFVFLPRFIKQRNLWRYLLEFLPLFALLSYGVLHGKQYLIDGFTYEKEWPYRTKFAVLVTFNTFFLVSFVGVLRFVEDWFELEATRKQLQNDNLTAELRFLKAQINPHFLFNTLNNLYYLAFTNSPNTTEVIAKLSQMMRYMIYESNHQRVPLSKEIEYLENYISLEKLRLEAHIPIDFEVEGKVENVRIAPLILITFLENAFKHGISNSQKEAWIKANLVIKEQDITYTVSNSKIPKDSRTVTEKSGIGLQNVKRRLELSYPNQYQLDIQDAPNTYDIELKIKN